MRNPLDRRKFLKIAGTSLGFGALYRVMPELTSASAADGVAKHQVMGAGRIVILQKQDLSAPGDRYAASTGHRRPLGHLHDAQFLKRRGAAVSAKVKCRTRVLDGDVDRRIVPCRLLEPLGYVSPDEHVVFPGLCLEVENKLG